MEQGTMGANDKPTCKVAVLGLSLAVFSILLGISSGFGARYGLWQFGTGFGVLRWAVYVAIAAAALSATAVALIVWRRVPGLWLALIGLLAAAVVIIVPLQWLYTARSVPGIHDITTDTTNPPTFVVLRSIRSSEENSAEYGGSEIAAQQSKAYPDIRPLILDVSMETAYTRAVAAALEMGWEIVATDAHEGRIEATDTTFWFGFKDDVVVRVATYDDGSIVDVRSVSRVGRSDIGTNARRVRNFIRIFNHRE